MYTEHRGIVSDSLLASPKVQGTSQGFYPISAKALRMRSQNSLESSHSLPFNSHCSSAFDLIGELLLYF